MIVAGVWAGIGFSNLKNSRNRAGIQKFWNKSGVGVWKIDSGHLWCKNAQSYIPIPHIKYAEKTDDWGLEIRV